MRVGAEAYFGQFAFQFYDNNFAAYGLAELATGPWDYGKALCDTSASARRDELVD